MTLALYRYQLPFTQPLTFHGKVEVAREGLLVRINDGWGEIAPLPGFSKESLQQAEAEALATLAALAAGDTPNPVLPSVQFGLDCARRTWPEQRNPLPEPYPLIQGSPPGAAAQLERVAAPHAWQGQAEGGALPDA